MFLGFNAKVEDILEIIPHMNRDELEKIAGHVFNILKGDTEDASVYTLFEGTDQSCCKKCGALHVVKRGKNAKGHQKYWCKDCGCIFTVTSETVFSYTHKSADTWKDFIKYTLDGRSMRYCAEKCGISLPTSFTWRHKIMNALSSCKFAEVFNGLIEIDELFVNVSYKGNHKRSTTFVMPRKAFKRGTDNHSYSSKDKACVLTAVNRGKNYSGIVTHCGCMNTEILAAHFDDRIADEAIVMTDESPTLKSYFSNRDYDYIPLASSSTDSSSKSPPVTKGPYHINSVNGLHYRFRRFLRKYNGVATKYLNSYLALFIWLENSRITNKTSPNNTIDYLIENGKMITYGEICAMLPPVA